MAKQVAVFTLIDNNLADPVVGNFAGQLGGSLVNVNGFNKQISYIRAATETTSKSRSRCLKLLSVFRKRELLFEEGWAQGESTRSKSW
ncbi:hypothetical protein ETAA8_65520 [Anatilimnocola aggregata]|uniref:Uncharacterized protein n=1 Tax=Anatilimnocola aggregata TaxID=2528021 RepID=A0A517YME8_9BACT|nr:hypothetical protein [Anatilimnocola aggregata]QDU31395.1 hypothetical protein ETAA8_65520 [Anatilimnocola aggregata]